MPRTKKNLNDSLVPLLDGPATRSDLGLSKFQTKRLTEEGLLVPIGHRALPLTKSDGTPVVDSDGKVVTRRGHPEMLFKASSKGRARARRIRQKQVA